MALDRFCPSLKSLATAGVDSRRLGAGVAFALAAEAQLLDEGLVPVEVFAFQVIQQLATPRSHHEQTPSRMKILSVGLEVLGQVRNAGRKQGDLYFTRSRVFLMGSVFLDYTLLVDVFGHVVIFCFLGPWVLRLQDRVSAEAEGAVSSRSLPIWFGLGNTEEALLVVVPLTQEEQHGDFASSFKSKARRSFPIANNMPALTISDIMDVPYFAYGSNMNLGQMADRCPGARMVGLARKPGWRFIINGRGYVTAVDDPSAETLGCLWELTEHHWEILDRYEGVAGDYYRRVDCDLMGHDSEEQICSIAYRATDETTGVPSITYADTVIEGARQIGLPETYLAFLESWRNGPSIA